MKRASRTMKSQIPSSFQVYSVLVTVLMSHLNLCQAGEFNLHFMTFEWNETLVPCSIFLSKVVYMWNNSLTIFATRIISVPACKTPVDLVCYTDHTPKVQMAASTEFNRFHGPSLACIDNEPVGANVGRCVASHHWLLPYTLPLTIWKHAKKHWHVW